MRTPPSIRARASVGKAFTLIELLVVISIIALLIGLLVPALSGAYNRAKATGAQAQMYGIAKACEMYRNDFGSYPGLVNEPALAAQRSNLTGAQSLVISLSEKWQLGTGGIDVLGNGDFNDFTVSSNLNDRPVVYSQNSAQATEYSAYLPLNPKQLSTNSEVGGDFSATGPSASPIVSLKSLPAFVDSSFKGEAMPILYYRNSSQLPPYGSVGPAMATALDSAGGTANFYAGTNARILDNATSAAATNYLVPGADNLSFERDVCDYNAGDTTHNNGFNLPKGSFVLVSAGIDRVYGTRPGDATNPQKASDDIVFAGSH